MEKEGPYGRPRDASWAGTWRERAGYVLRPGTWWAHVRDALRPEGEPAPLTRRAVVLDVVLALVLTVVALVVATRYPGDGPVRISSRAVSVGRDGLPYPVRPPVPGAEAVYDPRSSAPWGLVVLSALPLVARRRFPLLAFGVIAAAALALGDAVSWINVLTCSIAAYGAVAHSRYRTRALAALIAAAVLAGVAFRDTDPILPGWSSPAVVLLVVGVLASLVRLGRLRLEASRKRFTDLQRAQEEATRRAVEEERARIAAELHDVVTHNVSVMVIQAGAARKVMDAAPERSKEALLAVEAGGRAAMAELRHVMGLLAGPDASTDTPADGLEPQPGLGQLDALAERVRAAGTPVGLTVSLPPVPLPPGVELTAYRVVQEALTNTIKHAAGAGARVTVGFAGSWLEIEVSDTGAVRESPAVDGNGRGLIGLRERLALYGGRLTAGPTPTGGYQVTARIPWEAV
ncbi:sensor histidine kinase [Streptomyces triticiradicis]|uniref:histidine kinase n=1 Tax=Streptomyces triticiradicis TaxID=2651189 RepID=A0A7J5DAI6_9ACTN|nr:histidine kinase [Streptomyces triticiradicis]KAB1985779.1 two-component sensor histidine kinase [Streptomyces triticiradicis]